MQILNFIYIQILKQELLDYINENELDKNSVCSKMEHTAEDEKKYKESEI